MKTENIATGVACTVFGAVLGVLASHLIESNRYMKKLETEVSRIRASYENNPNEDKEEETETDSDDPHQEAKPVTNAVNEPNQKIEKLYRDVTSIYKEATADSVSPGVSDEPVNYSTYSQSPKVDKETKVKTRKNKSSDDIPYVITADDYYDTFPEFSKCKATWYAESHELVDDEDTILDVDATIGYDIINGDWPDDGVIHVRNIMLGADYEITFCDSAYDYNLF